jgi:RNA polymerase sigma-70 factor (ECF subfamily)
MPKTHKKPTRTDPDEDLVRALQSGEAERFHELLARYEQKLYNFGMRMCRNAQDAEDLVQDTFINVFRYLKGFRFEARFKNWMYKIAASVCIKKRRASKYAPATELSLDDFLPGEGEQLAADVPRWATLPLDHVLNEELAETLRAAIHALPPKYRIVAVLRDVEGFSTLETARILDLTPSNVKVRLHRARLFLREKLKDYFKDEPQTRSQ